MSVRGVGRKVTRAFDVFDGIEAVFYGLGGLVVLVVVLTGGTIAAHNLTGPAGAGGVIAGCVLVMVLAVRDVLRRGWSVPSIGLATAYAIASGPFLLIDSLAD